MKTHQQIFEELSSLETNSELHEKFMIAMHEASKQAFEAGKETTGIFVAGVLVSSKEVYPAFSDYEKTINS